MAALDRQDAVHAVRRDQRRVVGGAFRELQGLAAGLLRRLLARETEVRAALDREYHSEQGGIRRHGGPGTQRGDEIEHLGGGRIVPRQQGQQPLFDGFTGVGDRHARRQCEQRQDRNP